MPFSTIDVIDIESHWSDWLQTFGWGTLAVLLIVVCLASWMSNLIAMPGNWLCVLFVALYAWLGPQEGRIAIDINVVIATFVLSLIGEVIEFAAGAAGAKRAGASGKSTLYSILGSVAGAILGAIIGVPIPIVGSVVAALLFGGIGAAVGAMYGEWTDGRRWKENWSIGHATFWGRTFGTLSKFLCGFLILVIILLATLL